MLSVVCAEEKEVLVQHCTNLIISISQPTNSLERETETAKASALHQVSARSPAQRHQRCWKHHSRCKVPKLTYQGPSSVDGAHNMSGTIGVGIMIQ